VSFQGFPAETFDFLRGLSANNSREWFQEHRTQYERAYRGPAIEFIAALGPRLEALAPGLRYEPRVGGSLFRVNRDTRFSKDKTPYKDHIDVFFWFGEDRGWETPGFFFRMLAGELILGAGMHKLSPEQLSAFRGAVADPGRGDRLSRIIAAIEQAGYPVGGWGAELKRTPRGYVAPPEREWLLRQTGLFAMQAGLIPEEAGSPQFVDYCLERYTALWPMNRWLLEVLQEAGDVGKPTGANRR
jgi:uncharacterized protein (TIGR02453 family)